MLDRTKLLNLRRTHLFCKAFLIQKILKKDVVLTDWANNKYWQTVDDDLFSNLERNAVSDAINVTNLVNKIVQPGWTCLDIGACIGSTSAPMWRKVGKQGKVFSIEADPNNISRIKKNLKLNGYSASRVYNFAVCNHDRNVDLTIIPEQNGWQSLGDPSSDPRIENVKSELISQKVKGITLTTFCKKYKIEHVNFMKMDIEGAELEALKGARNLLKSQKIDLLVFEVNQSMLDWFDIKIIELIDYIKKYNYKLFRVSDSGDLIPFNKWPGDSFGDCLAVSPEYYESFSKLYKKNLKKREPR